MSPGGPPSARQERENRRKTFKNIPDGDGTVECQSSLIRAALKCPAGIKITISTYFHKTLSLAQMSECPSNTE